MILKIFNELKKNFKLLFRNWTSLSLLIIAPLLLILLVGFSFASDQMHDINIGYIHENEINISGLRSNVSDYATLEEYKVLEECLADIYLQETHLCLVMRGNFSRINKTTIPNGEITFYYDNSQKALSTLVISHVKEFFGLTSQEISLVSAQQIFDQIQNLVYFLNDRIDEIDKIKEESELIKQDLIQRKQRLISVRESFLPKYLAVKEAQTRINNYTKDINKTVEEIDKQILILNSLNSELDLIFSNLNKFISTGNMTFEYNVSDICNLSTDFNISYNKTGYHNLSEICNETNQTVNLSLKQYWNIMSSLRNKSVSEMNENLENLSQKVHATHNQTLSIKSDFDSIVEQLDEINFLLEDEINRTDYYIEMIENSTESITNLSNTLNEKLEKLTGLDPELAEKLVKPISQKFKEILPDLDDIQMAFPLVLVTIIVFISMLFSNVVTILEINNKANIRKKLDPVNDIIFTTGIVITNFIIVLLQVFVLLLVGEFKFNMAIFANFSNLFPVICILIFIFTLLGMCFAYFSKATQTSILLTTFVALGFFLFSNAINSLHAMPPLAAKIASFNPLVIGNNMFRQILLFEIPLKLLLKDFLILISFALVLSFFLFIVSKNRNQKRF